MIATLTGYPRIGANRELKFALEKYFRNEMPWQELADKAAALRAENYRVMKEKDIDLLPVGDFSYYDNTLDAAFMTGVVPSRYLGSGLSDDEIYFAMARGLQNQKADLKALSMKKWFNTNYHYIEPEYDGVNPLKLNTFFLEPLISQAEGEDFDCRICITGPFTLASLVRITDGSSREEFARKLIPIYTDLIAWLNNRGCQWLSLAEPSLVKDLTKDDTRLFTEIYSRLLEHRGNLKINLDTFFGDIRDVYQDAISLNFDGISLDFVEGSQTIELVRKHGFPSGALLTAGVISGRNIWRANYDETVRLLLELKDRGIRVAVGTSCSLLHVPLTLRNEPGIAAEKIRHLAFAEEKLAELRDLKAIVNGQEGFEQILAANRDLFARARTENDPQIAERIAALGDDDFRRLPARSRRQELQRKKLGLPLFPTTTIGSFPQTAEVRGVRRKFRNREISAEEYRRQISDITRDCLKRQEDLGLDILVHGEFERNDMVEYFGEHLSGFLFTANGWVQSYGSRCVKPPVIWSDISRKEPITVEMSRLAQSMTGKPVKGMLTGPVTILNWSFPRIDVSLRTMVLQLALALKEEVEDLEKAGIGIIQIDEAALKEKLPLRKSDQVKEYLEFAVPSFRLLESGLRPETQVHTHMCYSEFGEIIPWIDSMDADVITFEASRSDLRLLDSLSQVNFGTEVGPGVYDIHSPRIPSVEEITASLEKIAEKTDIRKVWVNPDCGLKTRGWKETEASLKNMVEAAKIMRARYDRSEAAQA
ncbi:MAG: 5-methyltetrahydropteroyltriglutamate--homocysteine S-methyltransferase [Succinivibrionaceae bacterium]|nr:5-methyltetrahydropteroyltriglutamate--homocysteine S-methyltransferase [Succinivibrionaceae bacterium]